jgi:HEAT repeat protein
VVVPALVAALKTEKIRCRYSGSMASYDTPDVKRAIAWSLGRFGKDAVPALVELLGDPSEEARWCALYSLGEIGAAAMAAAGAVAGRIQDENSRVGSLAVYTLAQVDTDPKRVIPYLIEALKSKSDRVRFAAADTVGKYGPKARAAVPLLIEIYKANNVEIGGSHWVVGESLKKINPEAARGLGIK